MTYNSLCSLGDKALTVVVFGASGDLASKKTFPALFELYRTGLLPAHASIVGYARSELTRAAFEGKVSSHFPKADRAGSSSLTAKSEEAMELEENIRGFLAQCSYVRGQYDEPEDVRKLATTIAGLERSRSSGKIAPKIVIASSASPHVGTADGEEGDAGAHEHNNGDSCGTPKARLDGAANRVFYFALPPSVFGAVASAVKGNAMSPSGWNRMIVEKPFGRDLESSNKLTAELAALFDERQLFRCDHFIQKQMVQTLTSLRFANAIYEPLWNREHISSVIITFKEAIGVEGRGGYFDKIGIVRDVMQNHLLQIMSLVAMEPPRSARSEDVRDAKVEMLRCLREIDPADIVLGQYEGWEKKEPSRRIIQDGYLDDPMVPEDSKCPTFATIVFHVDNDRWRGVPFIMKAAKATNERKTEIRVQFKPPSTRVFDPSQCPRNELVLRVQPKEAVYLKMNALTPGLVGGLVETELDLSFNDRYSDVRIPEAYERLIFEVLLGKQEHFVRSDELEEAWKLFTPILHRMDNGELPIIKYPFGSRGPKESDDLIKQYGYVRSETYRWN